MQSVTFECPILTENYKIRIGGLIDKPFVERKAFLPFQEREFELVQKTFTLEANETLAIFWGVDNNFPAPPTLNGTGRGSGLITPFDLAIIHAELTAVYGYPAWLSVTIKDFLLYDMQQKNEMFLQYSLPFANNLEKKLSEFAMQAKGFILKKIILQINTTLADKQKKSFFEYTIDEGDEKIQNKKIIASYLSSQQAQNNLVEISFENWEIDYNKFISFEVVGEIDTTHVDGIHNNNYSLIALGLRSSTTVFASSYRLLDYGIAPIPIGDNVSLTLLYEEKEKPIVFFPPIKLQKNQTEADEKQDTDTLTEPASNRENWIFLVLVLLVILLIVLQKASKN